MSDNFYKQKNPSYASNIGGVPVPVLKKLYFNTISRRGSLSNDLDRVFLHQNISVYFIPGRFLHLVLVVAGELLLYLEQLLEHAGCGQQFW
jgi:hypothetical protein